MVALGSQDVPGAADGPVEAVLRIPHPALLIGGSLAFLAAATSVSLSHQVVTAGMWSAGSVVLLLGAAMAALGSVVLVGVRRAQTMTATLIGLLLLDVMPALMQFGSDSALDARSRVLFLVIPTVIAASSVAAAAHRIHIAAAVTIAALMVGVPGPGRGVFDRLVEVCLAVGVLIVADLLVRRLSRATAGRLFQLRQLSLTDGLTGVLNRRGFAAGFAGLVRSTRRDTDLGLMIVDIDHFKWFNDEYGHAAGDEILRQVCRVLAESAGPGNLVARIGGEELAVIVVGRVEPVADAFRAALTAVRPRVTTSIGVIDVRHEDCLQRDALWRILDAADRALYEAKNTGRDRVCRASLTASSPAPAPRPETPAPQAAAVRPDRIRDVMTPSTLTGWGLTVFAAIGLVAVLGRDPRPLADAMDWLFLACISGCVVAGLLMIGLTPRLGPGRLVAGVIGADLVIALGVLDAADPVAKRVALLPLLLTGLLVAQHLRRGMVLAHHLLVIGVCLLALGGGLSLVVVVGSTLHAVVLIGSAELIYGLRRRHDVAAEDLHRWSVTDPLTGLANRRGLELAFSRMPRGRDITVLAVDVDDFKAVNDRHGHAVGDDALIRLAATLKAVTGPGTVVGRTGGDEFVLLAPGAHAAALTSRLARAAALLPVPLSISIGSTLAAPYHRVPLWELVAAADVGLTRAKRSRRTEAISRRRPADRDTATGDTRRPVDTEPDLAEVELDMDMDMDMDMGTAGTAPSRRLIAVRPLRGLTSSPPIPPAGDDVASGTEG